MAEGHPEFADDSIEIDAELVGQAQHLALPDMQVHRRVARVIAQYLADLVNLQLVQRGRWHAQARGTQRDELFHHQRALVAQVLARSKPGDSGTATVLQWLARDDGSLRFTLGMLADMRNQVSMDYPTVSVAIRRLAQLVQAGARGA